LKQIIADDIGSSICSGIFLLGFTVLGGLGTVEYRTQIRPGTFEKTLKLAVSLTVSGCRLDRHGRNDSGGLSLSYGSGGFLSLQNRGEDFASSVLLRDIVEKADREERSKVRLRKTHRPLSMPSAGSGRGCRR
jgi:hypothetical protein